MKQFLFAILFFVCATHVSAQDVIVKKDGSTILSKVYEVNIDNIKYKKFSNPNGPTYTISKAEIMSINYENGEKEDFNGEEKLNNTQQSGQGMIKKPADANNAKIIEQHNIIHPNFNGKSPSTKAATIGTVKYGIKSSSMMSNEDVEIEFVRDINEDGYFESLCYFINIKNKTDRVLYIDKGNCFRVYNDGYSYCYFDASKQTTVNNGGGSGAFINVGSVAGALGIGGAIGQIAGGVNVGGSSSSSVSTTYSSQRFIAIPPHGNKFLTEYVYVGEGKRRTCVEEPENFDMFASTHNCNNFIEIGLKRGVVNKNDAKVFDENELPWKREYYITYSTDANFSSYSTLHTELYIQEIIGDSKLYFEFVKYHKKNKWFQNKNTIISDMIFLDKK